jgi:hypothetical protein
VIEASAVSDAPLDVKKPVAVDVPASALVMVPKPRPVVRAARDTGEKSDSKPAPAKADGDWTRQLSAH